jgi:hypothetical protein
VAPTRGPAEKDCAESTAQNPATWLLIHTGGTVWRVAAGSDNFNGSEMAVLFSLNELSHKSFEQPPVSTVSFFFKS